MRILSSIIWKAQLLVYIWAPKHMTKKNYLLVLAVKDWTDEKVSFQTNHSIDWEKARKYFLKIKYFSYLPTLHHIWYVTGNIYIFCISLRSLILRNTSHTPIQWDQSTMYILNFHTTFNTEFEKVVKYH